MRFGCDSVAIIGSDFPIEIHTVSEGILYKTVNTKKMSLWSKKVNLEILFSFSLRAHVMFIKKILKENPF